MNLLKAWTSRTDYIERPFEISEVDLSHGSPTRSVSNRIWLVGKAIVVNSARFLILSQPSNQIRCMYKGKPLPIIGKGFDQNHRDHVNASGSMRTGWSRHLQETGEGHAGTATVLAVKLPAMRILVTFMSSPR